MAELESFKGRMAETTTLTGNVINILNPDPKSLTVEDIAKGLSNQCRYSGQVSQHYSVAQHSVLVAELVALQHPDNPLLILAALVHDAPEAYLVDIPTPLKRLMPQFVEIEDNFASAIATRFGFPESYYALIKPFDIAIRPDEMTQLTSYGKKHLEGPVLGVKIDELTPRQAEALFVSVIEAVLARLPELKKELSKKGPAAQEPVRKVRELSLA